MRNFDITQIAALNLLAQAVHMGLGVTSITDQFRSSGGQGGSFFKNSLQPQEKSPLLKSPLAIQPATFVNAGDCAVLSDTPVGRWLGFSILMGVGLLYHLRAL